MPKILILVNPKKYIIVNVLHSVKVKTYVLNTNPGRTCRRLYWPWRAMLPLHSCWLNELTHKSIQNAASRTLPPPVTALQVPQTEPVTTSDFNWGGGGGSRPWWSNEKGQRELRTAAMQGEGESFIKNMALGQSLKAWQDFLSKKESQTNHSE